MNLEKLKELAVPVSERLPNNDKSTDVILLYKGKEEQGRAFYQNDHWYISGVSYIGEQPVVTHWLDFDLLTSKKKALELAESCYDRGFNISTERYNAEFRDDYSLFDKSMVDEYIRNKEYFITENQSKL